MLQCILWSYIPRAGENCGAAHSQLNYALLLLQYKIKYAGFIKNAGYFFISAFYFAIYHLRKLN